VGERWYPAIIVAVLLGAMIYALHADLSQPRPLQPRPPSAPTQEQQTPSAEQHRDPNRIALPIEIVPGPDHAAEAAEQQQHANEHAAAEQDLADATWKLAYFTLALAGFAAVQVGLFFWQLRLIRDSLDDAKSAATAAGTAANAAERTATILGDTAKKELRAYLSDQPIGLKIWPNSDTARSIIHFIFINENHGQTPARNVRNIVGVSICPHPLPDDFVLQMPEVNIRSAIAIFPTQKFPSESSDFSITDERLVSIFRDDGERIYLFGVTRYDDIYGEPHETGVCVSCGGRVLKEAIENARRDAGDSGEGGADLGFDHSHRYNYER
jgi:hypothetical protein